MGQSRAFFHESISYWRKKYFMIFLLRCLKKLKTLDVPLMTWKKYGGNKCKLVVISIV
jgi:hypothetical protein